MMDSDRVRVKRKTLEMVLQQCQIAIQQLASGCDDDDDDDDDGRDDDCELDSVPRDSTGTSPDPAYCDTDTPEFYDVLKSRLECPDFLKKLENAQASLPQNMTEESSSWDMISENDLWEGENVELDSEDYVLVSQEDIMEGIAAFMAAYLSSLKQTKDLTPNQLQEVLSKTFSIKKKKGKLRKAFDGTKVIYNVASWGATAIGFSHFYRSMKFRAKYEDRPENLSKPGPFEGCLCSILDFLSCYFKALLNCTSDFGIAYVLEAKLSGFSRGLVT